MSGLALLAYQSYLWLKTGAWVEYPMRVFLQKADIDLTAVYSPQSWQGVAAVARWFIDSHAGLCLLSIGVVLLFLGFFIEGVIQSAFKP